ncbi:hypothetical protein FU659_15630 [Paenibacillus sp. N3.4]|nr:hypothetical protein FU659_15630 [Paenibacillus sp. N3.4]
MALQPLMYVVLLGLVLIVYARFLPKNSAASSPKTNVVQEIEETIEHFAAEMDEQNQALLDLFSRTKQDYEIELAKLAGRLESLEKQKHELSQELTKAHVSQLTQLTPNSPMDMVVASQREAINEQNLTPVFETIIEKAVEQPTYPGLSMKSRYMELFALHDEGKGVEAIAKKLGMNKGEVSLILQLSRQEEQTRV